MSYNHKDFEAKWQQKWEKQKLYAAKDDSDPSTSLRAGKEKYYVLVEFPYPSGDGLHVGHCRSYTALDIVARKNRMEGKNVLFPMGFDAFGLPTENYAIKNKIHPREATDKNIANFTKQLKSIGFGFDWDRVIDTTDPDYYKWTQWIFLKFLEAGLAYQAEIPINWCLSCKIGLANEEVVNGKCERCGGEIERRVKKQWMLAITKYAQKLLDGLDEIDFLPRIEAQQRNWIGKSVGAEVAFGIKADINKRRGRSPKGCCSTGNQARPSPIALILSQDIPDVKRKRNPKISLRKLYKKLDTDKGTIVFDGKALATHFKRAKNAKEFKYRDQWRITVLKALPVLFYENDTVGYFRVKHSVFRVVLTKTKKNTYVVKTFYRVRNVSKALAEKGRPVPCGGYSKGNSICPHFSDDEILNQKIKVFTTRPDTLFGATYTVLSPEAELVQQLKAQIKNWDEVEQYIDEAAKKSDLERTELAKDKTGVKLDGVMAVNPVNGEEIPIFVADYVLASYGTGAIMAVPAHDERDHEFATKFGVEIKEVVKPLRNTTGTGVLIKDQEGNFLFQKRDNQTKRYPGMIAPFGGEISREEKSVECIQREMAEELGITIEANNLKCIGSFESDFEKNTFIDMFYLEDIDSSTVKINEGEALVKISLEDASKDAKVTDFTKRVIESFQSGRRECFTGEGTVINSGEFDGLPTAEFKEKIIEKLEKDGTGKKAINFKLRDWVFSRQRYWGEPIPIIHCEKCGAVPAVADFAKYLHNKNEDNALLERNSSGGDPCVRRVESSNSKKILAQQKNGEDALSRQVETGGSAQVCLIDSPIKKEGSSRPGRLQEDLKIPTGGSPYVCRAKPSNSLTIISSNAYECKLKFKRKNNRQIARFIAKELRQGKFLFSPKLGKIQLNWNFLRKHFRKKRFSEFLMRLQFLPTIIEILKNFNFYEISSKDQDSCLIYGRHQERVFTIVLQKNKKNWIVKTFFQSKKLTKSWQYLVKNFSLPLTLPDVQNYEPTDTGESPLAAITDWVNTECPACGSPAKRETDTMPNWAGSSWYFLRYIDPKNDKAFADPEKLKYWTPVDLYNGGMEHTVLHLLYSRFWHKFLYDQKLVPTSEPYARRISHGMILGSDGEKMSKSRGNVQNPDDIIEKFGADTLRVYEMFIGPFDQAASWNEGGVAGVRKFLEKVERLLDKPFDEIREDGTCETGMRDDVRRLTHKTVKKVTDDLHNFHFNTAVSALMIFVNEIQKCEKLPKKTFEKFLTILAPFAPHLCEELWERLGHEQSIHLESWPSYDEALAKDDEIELVIQVNGKLRDTISVAADIDKDAALDLAKESEKVVKWLEGKEIRKEIFVPGKLVNLVIA